MSARQKMYVIGTDPVDDALILEELGQRSMRRTHWTLVLDLTIPEQYFQPFFHELLNRLEAAGMEHCTECVGSFDYAIAVIQIDKNELSADQLASALCEGEYGRSRRMAEALQKQDTMMVDPLQDQEKMSVAKERFIGLMATVGAAEAGKIVFL